MAKLVATVVLTLASVQAWEGYWVCGAGSAVTNGRYEYCDDTFFACEPAPKQTLRHFLKPHVFRYPL